MITHRHRRKALLALSFWLALFLTSACDEFTGTRITYRNDTGQSVTVFTDEISDQLVDENRQLLDTFENYERQMRRFDPGDTKTLIHDGVYTAEADDLFVVTAVNRNDEIVYQEVFTAAVLKDENHVVVMPDQ